MRAAQVNSDEGGLTHWEGRDVSWARHIVLPAGYLGSTAWGVLIIMGCISPTWARAVSLALLVALVICFFYAGDDRP